MPTTLPNPRTTPRFAGIATFCRYPRIEDVPAGQPIDWALYGVPFDGGVTYRPGARFAPRAIREASQYVKRFHLEHGVDVCEKLSLCDAGDASISPYHLKETLEGVAAWAAALGAQRTNARPGEAGHPKLLAVGGDHSIAYANIKAVWERRGKPKGGLALIHFDSHLDTVDSVWNEKWGHASPFIRCIEEGLIDPRAMISVGIKGPLNTADDLAFAQKHGVRIVTRDAAAKDPTWGFLRDFVHTLGSREAYLTFDIDVVDPAFAPGTGTPSAGGFTSHEALSMLRALRGVRLAGADVVEVLPDRDLAGITAFLAAHVMFEVLALDACVR